jgi:hypothetical protein
MAANAVSREEWRDVAEEGGVHCGGRGDQVSRRDEMDIK